LSNFKNSTIQTSKYYYNNIIQTNNNKKNKKLRRKKPASPKNPLRKNREGPPQILSKKTSRATLILLICLPCQSSSQVARSTHWRETPKSHEPSSKSSAGFVFAPSHLAHHLPRHLSNLFLIKLPRSIVSSLGIQSKSFLPVVSLFQTWNSLPSITSPLSVLK
jgi:hypothetical protein